MNIDKIIENVENVQKEPFPKLVKIRNIRLGDIRLPSNILSAQFNNTGLQTYLQFY